MKSENIRTVWRFGYIKLFTDTGLVSKRRIVSMTDGEWQRIIWRFYWRIDNAN